MKVHRIILLLLLLAIGLPILANAQDSIPLLEKCKSCVYAVGGKAPSSVLLKMAGIVAVIVLATLFGWFTYHKKRYIFFGSVATLLVIGSYVFAIEKYKNKEYPIQSCDSTICITDSLNAVSTIDSLNPFVVDEFLPVGGEFENLSEFTTASDDEFSEVSSELNEFSDNESEVSQIHSVDAKIKINTEDCILCGDCIGTCTKGLLSVKRNSI
jgi:ferredoxin